MAVKSRIKAFWRKLNDNPQMKIVDSILSSPYFKGHPPVLIDIGASGKINAKWKRIASYSVCIAFDADEREFHMQQNAKTRYYKLLTFNRVLSVGPASSHPFYLTSSPYCSSLLEPDEEKLNVWLFKDLFRVEKVATLPAVTLSPSLQQAGLDYVDWFKSDSQGVDLRLFKTLSLEQAEGVLAAEFEPGIMDAYKGEDKLYMVMQEMERRDFWLSSMEVKGTQRLRHDYSAAIGSFFTQRIVRKSPCWTEVTYLRLPAYGMTQRQLLLLFVFALLERQYGFALEVIDFATKVYSDLIFPKCRKAVLKKMAIEKWKTPLIILKRQLNKLLSSVND